MSEGRLIALEGADDAAVAALQERLYRWLQGAGVPVERAQMPTRGPIGLLLHVHAQGRLQLDPASLALLWTADRLDLLGREDGVRAWLAAGRAVLCTHYRLRAHATLLETPGLDGGAGWLAQIDAPCPTPDLTLYLAPAAGSPYARALAALTASGARVAQVPGERSPEAHVAALLGM